MFSSVYILGSKASLFAIKQFWHLSLCEQIRLRELTTYIDQSIVYLVEIGGMCDGVL